MSASPPSSTPSSASSSSSSSSSSSFSPSSPLVLSPDSSSSVPRSSLSTDYYSRLQEERAYRKQLQEVVEKYKISAKSYEAAMNDAEERRNKAEERVKQMEEERKQREEELKREHARELAEMEKRVRNQAREHYDALSQSQKRLFERDKEEGKRDEQKEMEERISRQIREAGRAREEEQQATIDALRRSHMLLEQQLNAQLLKMDEMEGLIRDQKNGLSAYASRYAKLFIQMRLKNKYKYLCRLLIVKLYVVQWITHQRVGKMRRYMGMLIEEVVRRQRRDAEEKQKALIKSAGRRRSTEMIGIEDLSALHSVHASSSSPSSLPPSSASAAVIVGDGDTNCPDIQMQSEIEAWYEKNLSISREEAKKRERKMEIRQELAELMARKKAAGPFASSSSSSASSPSSSSSSSSSLSSASSAYLGLKEALSHDQQVLRLRFLSHELFRSSSFSLQQRVDHLLSAIDILSVTMLHSREEVWRQRKEAESFVLRNTELHGELLIESREKNEAKERVRALEEELGRVRRMYEYASNHCCACVRTRVCVCECKKDCKCWRVEGKKGGERDDVIGEVREEDEEGDQRGLWGEDTKRGLSTLRSTSSLHSSSSPSPSSSSALLQANKSIRVLRHRLHSARSLLSLTQSLYDKMCARLLLSRGPSFLLLPRPLAALSEQQMVAMALAAASGREAGDTRVALPSAAVAQMMKEGKKATLEVVEKLLLEEEKEGEERKESGGRGKGKEKRPTAPPGSFPSSPPSERSGVDYAALAVDSVDEMTRSLSRSTLAATAALAATSSSSSSSSSSLRSPRHAGGHSPPSMFSSPSSVFKSNALHHISMEDSISCPSPPPNNLLYVSRSSSPLKKGAGNILSEHDRKKGFRGDSSASTDLMSYFSSPRARGEELSSPRSSEHVFHPSHPLAQPLVFNSNSATKPSARRK